MTEPAKTQPGQLTGLGTLTGKSTIETAELFNDYAAEVERAV